MGLRERFENAGVDSFHCLIRMETPDGAADTVFGCVRPDARAACFGRLADEAVTGKKHRRYAHGGSPERVHAEF